MKNKWLELQRLKGLAEELLVGEQTPKREFERTRIEFEVDALEGEIQAAVSRRAMVFLDAWRRGADFEAIRDDGARARPVRQQHRTAVEEVWHIRSECERLSRWSFGLSP